MPGWKRSIDIKKHFAEVDPDDEDAVKGAASRILDDLPSSAWGRDMMASAAESGDQMEFNDALERIYDWGDYSRTWLGL